MKPCRPGWKRWVALVFMVILLGSMTLFAFYLLVFGAPLPYSERIYMIFGIPLFIGILVWLALRTLYFGPRGIDYNDERIIFHLSKKQEKNYRWEELLKEKIFVNLTMVGYIFSFSDKKEYVINYTMVGYQELIAMLIQKNVFQKNRFIVPEASFIQKVFRIFF